MANLRWEDVVDSCTEGVFDIRAGGKTIHVLAPRRGDPLNYVLNTRHAYLRLSHEIFLTG